MDQKYWARKILNDLNDCPPQHGIQPAGETGSCLYVLAVIDLPRREALRALRELFALRRFGCSLKAVARRELVSQLKGNPACGRVYLVNDSCEPDVLDGVRAVLAVLSPGSLAKLALGLQDDLASYAVLYALERGIDVFADFACADAFADGANGNPLCALYTSYIAAVRKMGVRETARGEYLAGLLDQCQAIRGTEKPQRPAASPQDKACFDAAAVKGAAGGARFGKGMGNDRKKMVITKRDMQAYDSEADEWLVPAGAVITPLAMDMAEKRGLRLRRQT